MVLFRIIKIFLPLLRWTQNPRRKTKHAETSMVILFPSLTHSWMIYVWKKSRLPVDLSTLGCVAQVGNCYTVKLYHQSPLRKLPTITYRVENWSPFLPASKLRACLKNFTIFHAFLCVYITQTTFKWLQKHSWADPIKKSQRVILLPQTSIINKIILRKGTKSKTV